MFEFWSCPCKLLPQFNLQSLTSILKICSRADVGGPPSLMAPAIVEPRATTSNGVPLKAVDLSIFPNGLKTSGQHPPMYSQLHPYSDFPKTISGPTVWEPQEYATNRSLWTHSFSDQELLELSSAADAFIVSSLPLTAIGPSNFPLSPAFATSLASTRAELVNGRGFILYRNLPIKQWSNHKSAAAYLGLGSYFGYSISQNSRGHILGHVKDLGEDSTQLDKVRIYRTNARQPFHCDKSDIVGLLCIAPAEEGGESGVTSVHHVWNILQSERPDIAKLFTKPIWYTDRKGETSVGEEGWIRNPVLYLETLAPGKEQRVCCKWNPDYVLSLTRFSDAGLVPPLSLEQLEAIDVFEETSNRVKLHMILEVGDIQFLSNTHILHARTAYRDYGPESGMPRRHLMRFWMALPEDEGGWRLPFKDTNEKKRGGIQVDDTAPVARLDAD